MIHRTRFKIARLFIALVWGLAAPVAFASVESELAFHRAVVAFGEGRYDAARADFEKVLAEDPQDTAAIQYLGLIAQEQGDPEAAVAHFERALALAPDDTDLRLDLSAALLEAGRVEEARTALDQVLAARPDDPRANLFAGIAAYRRGQYDTAISHLDRAKELDPSLATHATYYAGLSAAYLGNFAEAEGAFSAVEEQSPLSPLSRSAQNLRQQVTPAQVEELRPWALAITSGIEWDDNPAFAGKSNPFRPQGTKDFGNAIADFRGVFRIRGSYRFVDVERYSVTAGYDGYLSAHHDTDKMDLQTHVGWLSGTMNYDPVRFGLRYDYAFTMIDLSERFRHLHRITPSVTYREADWGVAQVFFQWQRANFKFDAPSVFDTDSNRYTFGVNQFFFLPERVAYLRYLRIGALGEMNRADSYDFSYDGLEVSAGGAADLPFEIQFTALWRFLYRDFRSINFLPTSWGTAIFRPRRDYVHRATFEVARPFGEHIEASVASSLDFTDSNIDLYDHNRAVVGAYLTYRF